MRAAGEPAVAFTHTDPGNGRFGRYQEGLTGRARDKTPPADDKDPPASWGCRGDC